MVDSLRQQFDDETELPRVRHISGGNGTDALDVDIFQPDAAVKRERRENDQLAGRVEAVDVARRVGFCVPQPPGFAQDVVELPVRLGHLREDEVTRAVHNSFNGRNLIRGQAFLERADEWDGAADGRFVQDGYVVLRGGAVDFIPVERHQVLVGGHHVLTGP